MTADHKILDFNTWMQVDVKIDCDKVLLLDIIIEYVYGAGKNKIPIPKNPAFCYVFKMKYWGY